MYDIQYIDIKGEKLQKNKGLQLMCKKKGGGEQTVYIHVDFSILSHNSEVRNN